MRKIKNAPGWLELTEDKTAFVFVEERAKIVQHIFEMSIAGNGGYTIAKLLNEAGVPAFGSSGKWDQSTIHNMLSSRATLGEYQKKQIIDGQEVPFGPPIPNHYPAVIDEKTFEAAQSARRQNLSARRGRKGRRITNLFSDIPRCMYCGNTVKLHNAPVKSLVCKTVWDRKGCFRFKWTYTDFEKNLLKQLLVLDPNLQCHFERLWQAPKDSDQATYQARMAASQNIRSTVRALKIAFAGPNPHSPSSGEIRRDHLDRFFEVTLADGRVHTGKPAPTHEVRAPRLNPAKICELLGLSQRQGLITAHLAEGTALKAISEEIGMSISTARWHVREIFKRTGCHSQAELIDLAIRVSTT